MLVQNGLELKSNNGHNKVVNHIAFINSSFVVQDGLLIKTHSMEWVLFKLNILSLNSTFKLSKY